MDARKSHNTRTCVQDVGDAARSHGHAKPSPCKMSDAFPEAQLLIKMGLFVGLRADLETVLENHGRASGGTTMRRRL